MRDAVGAEKLARGEVAPATQAAEDSRVAQAFERPLQVAVDGVSGVGSARRAHMYVRCALDLAAEGSLLRKRIPILGPQHNNNNKLVLILM